MKTHIDAKQDKTAETIAEQPDFNFELWAKQVRPQLLASLQKRGVK